MEVQMTEGQWVLVVYMEVNAIIEHVPFGDQV